MISVVMPAYNAEQYISEAIESILNQTFTQFELIIADDNSSDNTASIIHDYMKQDDRIRYVHCEERSAGGTRNIAIQQAQYPYIALMDADDIAYPNRLQTQYDAAQKSPEVVVWGCYMQCITPDGLPMNIVNVGPTSIDEFYALDRTQELINLYGTVAFFRRDIFEQVGGFNPDMQVAEDSELWDRMAHDGAVVVLPQVLQDYRQHAQSLSVTKLANERKYHSFIKARFAQQQNGSALTLAEYSQQYDRVSRFERWSRHMRGLSQGFGRRAMIDFAQKHYVTGVFHAICTVTTHPMRFILN